MKKLCAIRSLGIFLALLVAASPVFSQDNSEKEPEKESAAQSAKPSESKIDKAARRKAAREKAEKIEKQGKPARYPYKSSVEMPADM